MNKNIIYMYNLMFKSTEKVGYIWVTNGTITKLVWYH